MNWDAIGSIGEVVGAAAVVITLAYLAVQTKRSREATEAGGTLTSASLHSQWRRTVLSDPELPRLLAKTNSGEELSESEKIQLHILCDELFIAAFASYAISQRSGALHLLRTEVDYLADLLRVVPGIVPEWERTKSWLAEISPGLMTEIDGLLARRADLDSE